MRKTLLTILAPVAFALALLLPAGGAKALTLSPPFVDHAINPGDTVMEVIKLYNEDPYPFTFYPIPMNFKATGDEGGVPMFYPAYEETQGTELAKWVQVDQSAITIAPGERVNIPVSVVVPEDATPGGHFGAVIFSTSPPDVSGNAVGVMAQLATLIFIRVSGDVTEVGSIAEFGYKNPQVWYNHLPVDFFLRFENSGNVHLRPTGNLFISNWYGRQVASINVNETFSSVLPRTIRRYEFGWSGEGVNADDKTFLGGLKNEWNNFAFGKYRALLVLNYGIENKVIADEREFTVWPWRLMIVGGAALLLVILLIILFVKLYGKAVIRGYEKRRGKLKKADADKEKSAKDKLEQELRDKIEKEMRVKIEKEMREKKSD